jgi:uncharacterized protein YdhG (YjbR/CyaY superfamily)
MNNIVDPIDNYLAALPWKQKEALEKVRRIIKSVVPDAGELISTRVPAFTYKGKVFIGFSATRHHLSLLIMRTHVIDALKEDLQAYETSKSVIRFSPDKPLPQSLVKKIINARIREIEAKYKIR